MIDPETMEMIEIANLIEYEGMAFLVLPGWQLFSVGYLA